MIKTVLIHLTCYLAAVKFEPQSDAVLPRLRSDPDEASQNRLWDPVENHFGGVTIGMKNLWVENSRPFKLLGNYPEQEGV